MEKDPNRLPVSTIVLKLSLNEIRQWVAFQFGTPTHEESRGNFGSINNPFVMLWTVNSGESIGQVVARDFLGEGFAVSFFSADGTAQKEIEIARL